MERLRKIGQRDLGIQNKTEATERTLEFSMFREEVLKALRQLCEKGEVEDIFEHYRRQLAAKG